METTIQGKVIKGLGGLYEILAQCPDGTRMRLSCRAKGAFRHASEKVLIGDAVTIRYDDQDAENTAIIREILPRENSLIRPPMANLQYLFCVIAAAKPAPVLETLDKLLAIATHNHIQPVVVVTKADFSEEESQRYASIYEMAGFPTFVLSALDGSGIEGLKQYVDSHVIDGASAAFAGSSGVGKSTLLNALFPTLQLATGDISRRTERGKHTTRHVELFPLSEDSTNCGFLADTPGFSLLDFAHFDFFGLDDLFDAFPDFTAYTGECRYGDCTHTGEGVKECAIARAVAEGKIAPSRHESYIKIYKTLKSKNPYK
jgi:ribosome biogenesis GTPase